ncbi:hypothetical protein [Mongoliitalea daihaiensis]|uniref:hypothetical protein n=1 Tax=Mongoliitalea daihaiensis TaxID=2782006 RepID=UPI001F23DE55|nr:hypothetical protein [Mongoliitalea daihaiensis]UJP63653.1 hypothetical protein IPZ59_12495 [Mongoliitalea daihaiensis]
MNFPVYLENKKTVAKKKLKPQNTKFNPISYLRSGNARKLPIYECMIPKSWKEDKKFPILFSRKHSNGNLTFASILVDLLCTGSKDVLFVVNEPINVYHEIRDTYEESLLVEFVPVSYELIHNIIFESVAFAEDYGIAPHEDFRFVELILEEDTESFPRIDVPLGVNGKAHLHLHNGDDRRKYFEQQILKYGKKGTYEIFYHTNDPILDDESDDDDWEEDDDFLIDSCLFWDEEDWAEFYDNGSFEELPIDIVHHTIVRLPEYDFEKMKQEKLFAPFTKIKSTVNPTSKSEYSKNEIENMHQIYELLQDMNDAGLKTNPVILADIEKLLQETPSNKILWQYKWEYYQVVGDDQKMIETALEMKRRFPDYLFGLTCHAQSLIGIGQADEIPDAMNHIQKIQDIDPKREKFHKSELMAFYSPWIYYYSKTGQVRAAYFLMHLLFEHEVGDHFMVHPLVLEAYRNATTKVVDKFYSILKSGNISKDDFINMMM